jgi:hypothetical protein
MNLHRRLPPLLLAITCTGCVGVRRQLMVESQPAGALVYINGDEVGRTPLTHEFVYYGTMDVKLRKDGYETLEDRPRVWAPWWQIPPIDLVAEAFPLTDKHMVSYELTPRQQGAPPEELVRRGMELKTKLVDPADIAKSTTRPALSATSRSAREAAK